MLTIALNSLCTIESETHPFSKLKQIQLWCSLKGTCKSDSQCIFYCTKTPDFTNPAVGDWYKNNSKMISIKGILALFWGWFPWSQQVVKGKFSRWQRVQSQKIQTRAVSLWLISLLTICYFYSIPFTQTHCLLLFILLQSSHCYLNISLESNLTWIQQT